MTIKLHSEATGGYAVPLRKPAGALAESAPRAGVKARTIAWFVSAVVALSLSGRLVLWWLASVLDPAATVDFVMDDAYYYLQIAYNIGQHGRPTFDGITDTNGYQPAWMALLTSLAVLLDLDKKGLFVALQGLVTLALALPMLYCLKRHREPFFLALAAGLAGGYATFAHVFSCGMETALFAPAGVAVCAAAHEGLTRSARRVSFLFAGIVMIRLDAACLLVAYALPLGYQWYRSEGLRSAARKVIKFGLPAVLVMSLYMLYNAWAFGVATPISGLAKHVGAPPFANWGIFHYYLLHGTPVFIGLAMLLPIELLWTKFERGRFVYGAMGVLTVALVIHYIFLASFTGWIPWPWYFYAFALIMVMLVTRLVGIALMLATRPRWVKPWRGQLVALLAAALPTVFCAVYVNALLANQALGNQRRGGVPSGSFNRRNVADALAFANSKEPLTVAIGDRGVGLGYWAPANLTVFPLEGLVADKAYLDARKRDEGAAWVREHVRPRYLIVDREVLEPVRIGDEERYVVIEPIQGRVVLDHLLTYCFPVDAVVSQIRGRDDQPSVMKAPAVRITFDMNKAETCSGPFADYVQAAVFSPESLRRTSLAAEYAPEFGGELNVTMERFDRRLAVYMRTLLGGAE